MALESVSGLSQQALIIDVAAKVLADNMASLLCAAAAAQHDLAARSRKCNRSYAAALLQRVLPRLILIIGDWVACLRDVLVQLGANTQRTRSDSYAGDHDPGQPIRSSRTPRWHTSVDLKFGGLRQQSSEHLQWNLHSKVQGFQSHMAWAFLG